MATWNVKERGKYIDIYRLDYRQTNFFLNYL